MTRLTLIHSTLAFFIVAVRLPNTPAQFYVLFYPKISPMLSMLVLLARDPMALETRPSAFAGGASTWRAKAQGQNGMEEETEQLTSSAPGKAGLRGGGTDGWRGYDLASKAYLVN